MDKKHTELHLIYDYANTSQRILLNDNLENFDEWASPENPGGLNLGFTKEQEKPLGIEEFFKVLDNMDVSDDDPKIQDLSA